MSKITNDGLTRHTHMATVGVRGLSLYYRQVVLMLRHMVCQVLKLQTCINFAQDQLQAAKVCLADIIS